MKIVQVNTLYLPVKNCKKPRGYYDNGLETQNSILITKWVDNSVTTIGTNYDT